MTQKGEKKWPGGIETKGKDGARTGKQEQTHSGMGKKEKRGSRRKVRVGGPGNLLVVFIRALFKLISISDCITNSLFYIESVNVWTMNINKLISDEKEIHCLKIIIL